MSHNGNVYLPIPTTTGHLSYIYLVHTSFKTFASTCCREKNEVNIYATRALLQCDSPAQVVVYGVHMSTFVVQCLHKWELNLN